MIITDYILGAHYVPVCPKCFIRIVSFNSPISIILILYLLHEETGLGRVKSLPSPPRSHSRLTSLLYSSTIECLLCVLGVVM